MESKTFVSYMMQDGTVYTGYVLETEGSQIQLLAITGKDIAFKAFSKSALKETVEHRLLTQLEMELVNNYKVFAKEAGLLEAEIRQLQSDKAEKTQMKNLTLQNLSNFLHSEEKQGLNILTVSCLEENLSEVGYKNLFLLVRYGLVTLGEREEFFTTTTTGRLTPLIEKQKGKVLEILNESSLDKKSKSLQLFKLATEADNERLLFKHKIHSPISKGLPLDLMKIAMTPYSELIRSEPESPSPVMKETPINEKKEKEKEQEKQGSTLNILTLRDKLNERGFKTLKLLQERGQVVIEADGTILFKNMEDVPFLKPLFENENLLADVLNQSVPNLNMPIPFGELFKEFKTQIPELAPELDKLIRTLIKK